MRRDSCKRNYRSEKSSWGTPNFEAMAMAFAGPRACQSGSEFGIIPRSLIFAHLRPNIGQPPPAQFQADYALSIRYRPYRLAPYVLSSRWERSRNHDARPTLRLTHAGTQSRLRSSRDCFAGFGDWGQYGYLQSGGLYPASAPVRA